MVKQYKKGKGFQKVINLSIKDEFIHEEEVMVVSVPDYDDLISKAAADEIAAAKESKKDDKIKSLEGIITEKDSKITILTNQIQSLEKVKDDADNDKIVSLNDKIATLDDLVDTLKQDKKDAISERDDAIDERKELSRKLEDKDEALIKATALLTAYENQSWVDKFLNRKPKLKEAMDIYLAEKGTVDANAEVKDDPEGT